MVTISNAQNEYITNRLLYLPFANTWGKRAVLAAQGYDGGIFMDFAAETTGTRYAAEDLQPRPGHSKRFSRAQA